MFIEKTQTSERNVRRFIRIADLSLWEIIDKIMTLEEYSKSFNKVIVEALEIGLPELCNSLFENQQEVLEVEKEQVVITEDYLVQVVRLLKEVILNETINKSILCSLFEAKNLELNGYQINGKKFSDGIYRDTPQYLINYELKALHDLRK